MSVTELSGRLGLVGALAGLPVVESSVIAYDEMYISYETCGIVVGELAHFTYRLRQVEANSACRRAARVNIENQARRILGEEWTVPE